MERVTREVQGSDPGDTTARQLGALQQLSKVIEDMAWGLEHRYTNKLTPDENRLKGERNGNQIARSIRSGEPWIDEIFDQLSASAVGISLLSKDYVESGNCMHEARDMVAKLDNNNMRLVPVRLAGKEFKMPSPLRSIQYLEWQQGKDAEEIVTEIIELISK